MAKPTTKTSIKQKGWVSVWTLETEAGESWECFDRLMPSNDWIALYVRNWSAKDRWRKKAYWLGWSLATARMAKGKDYAAIKDGNPKILAALEQHLKANGQALLTAA